MAHRIAEIICKPYYKVLAVIKQKGGVMISGRHKSDDGTSKKEQMSALWRSGLHNVDMIAEKVNTSRKNVLWELNNTYGIKTRPTELAIDYEAEKIAKRQLGGDYARGEISALAKKFAVSRQFAHQRVNLAKEKLKNK
jgi:translation initiation factor 2 alpha subunit (eIF-2alpha)